jgi:hypothetical protein
MFSLDKNRIISNGVILIDGTTDLPRSLTLESTAAVPGWPFVAHRLDGQQLEKELTSEGWTLFYMGGAIRTIALGFERQKMVNAAMKRIFAAVRSQGCNCVEIDRVAMHSFLGIPYVSVSAHPRHIQQGRVFSAQYRERRVPKLEGIEMNNRRGGPNRFAAPEPPGDRAT